MHKTGMGRELRNESIACRPCSLNFVDKLLREVLDVCLAHLLRLSFRFSLLHENRGLRFKISRRGNTSKFGIFETFPS